MGSSNLETLLWNFLCHVYIPLWSPDRIIHFGQSYSTSSETIFCSSVTFSILLASFVCGGRYSDLFRNYPRYISFLLIWFKSSIYGGYPSLYIIIAVLFFVITAKMSLGYQKNIRRHVFDYMVAYAFPPNFVINI